MPPRFIAEPESQAVIPKSMVLFRSVFEGTPPFTVKWFKDDIELITGPLCMITLEKYSSSVELYSADTLCCGIYSCRVSNEAGAVQSAAQLSVKGWTILFFVHQHPHSVNSIFFLHRHSSALLHCHVPYITTFPLFLFSGISVLSSESPATCHCLHLP